MICFLHHYSFSSYPETPSEDCVLVQKQGLRDHRRQADESLMFLYRPVLPQEQCGPQDSSILLACSITQSCPTLCDPMDCSPPDSPGPRILQARILEWVVISFSRGSTQPRDRTRISCISCSGRQILYH